jgi:hypothetical protein
MNEIEQMDREAHMKRNCVHFYVAYDVVTEKQAEAAVSKRLARDACKWWEGSRPRPRPWKGTDCSRCPAYLPRQTSR